jgi:type I restriction enzyme S subunit
MKDNRGYEIDDKWYGDLPKDWKEQRIKTLFDLHDERNYLPLDEVNLISLYTSLGVLQHSDIEHTTGNRAQNADGYKIVNKDDIIVNILLCWMGAIGRSEYNGVTSPAYDIYTPKRNVNSYYYHYLFRTPIFAQQCYKAGKGIMAMRWRTYSPQFRSIRAPVPPVEIQEQIVRYLRWKESSVNELIRSHKQEIALLTELRKKIIDAAVTKGLSNAELTRFNDDRWDIDYPNHWDIKRIREMFSFRKGLSITKANLVEEGIPVISYGQVHSKKNTGVGVNQDLIRFVGKSYLETNTSSLVELGDFIFADTSEDVEGCGNCVYVDTDDTLFAGYHSIIMHPADVANGKYLAYLFQSQAWRTQIRKKVNGVKVYSITQQMLKDSFVLIPPEKEQMEIVSYLENICLQIAALVEKEHCKIEELRELKTRIITDTVTGKNDVARIEIPDYEIIEDVNNEDLQDEESGELEEQED